MARRIALVFGIGKYEHYQELQYSYASAREVFDLLVSKEYGQCEPKPISTIITDEMGEKIKSAGIYEAIDDTLLKLEHGDEFVFYYSGHADLIRNNLFLIPNGTKKPQDGFKFSTLITLLGQRNKEISVIIIVDACHSEAMIGAFQSWGDAKVPAKLGCLASAGYLELAREDDEFGRTRFSKYFCEGIKNGCGNLNKNQITLSDLSKYIDHRIAGKYGELAQKTRISSIGHEDDLWIAKRVASQRGEIDIDDKSMCIDGIIQMFSRDFVVRTECDNAVAYLKNLLSNLNIAQKNIMLVYKVRREIGESISSIEKFRDICRSKSEQVDTERKRILAGLQKLNNDLR